MSPSLDRTMAGLRRGQALLRLIGEVAWIAAWSLTLGTWLGVAGPLLSYPAIVAVFGLGALLARLIAGRARRHLALPGLALLGFAVAGLSACAAVPGGLAWSELPMLRSTPLGLRVPAVAALTLAAWWRGIALGRASPTLRGARMGAHVGVIALAALFILLVLLDQASTPLAGELVLPTLVFVGSALLVIPLANLGEVIEVAAHVDRADVTPSGPWLATLLLVVGALVLGTLLLAETVGFGSFSLLFGLLLRLFGLILLALVQTVGIALYLVLSWLIATVRTLVPLQYLFLALVVGGTLGFVGVVVATLLVMRRLGRMVSVLRIESTEEGGAEVRDSVWNWSGLGLGREGLFRFRWPRLSILSVRARSVILARSPKSVYDLYEELLGLGAEVGRPRRTAETPLEYEARLRGRPHDGAPVLPGEEEVHSITGSYVQARYGPPPTRRIDHVRLGRLVEALARLRALWQGARRD